MRLRKRNRKTRHMWQILRAVCYAVLTGLCCFILWRLEAGRSPGPGKHDLPGNVILTDKESDEDLEQDGDTTVLAEGDITLDYLYSPYAILIDAQTGQVLAERNSRERMYPASMTKLMAALVAVERTEDWDATIEIPQNIFAQLYADHASLAGFEPDEKVKPKDLLYGMLLPSGAECCTVYAMWLAGDEETFVEWMNEKAAELGMVNTHFVNTTGLHDEQHYSTAEDMSALMRKCIENETLRTVLQAEDYRTGSTWRHPQGMTLDSTLFQAIAENKSLAKEYEEEKESGIVLLGGKTGYTARAGLCLASFGRVDGREYILVTAGAEGSHYTDPFHIMDAMAVYSQIAVALRK